MYCQESGYADYLPVDVAVNAIFACSWNYLYFKDHDRRVFNLTSSSEFKVRCLILVDSLKLSTILINSKILPDSKKKKKIMFSGFVETDN